MQATTTRPKITVTADGDKRATSTTAETQPEQTPDVQDELQSIVRDRMRKLSEADTACDDEPPGPEDDSGTD